MTSEQKKVLIDHLGSPDIYNALVALIEAKINESLSVLGSSTVDAIGKTYKLISADGRVTALSELKNTLTEINRESNK